jgi:hydrogenase maturation protease
MIEDKRIVVLGLGNLIRSDDGIGVHAIRVLMKDPRVPNGVRLIEGGTAGLDLLPAIEDATHVLAIDAVNMGAATGTLKRFDLSELGVLPGSPSVHQLGFADLMEALRWMNKASKRVVLLGVQPSETGWGYVLSPEIEATLPRLTQAALDELEQWTLEIARPENNTKRVVKSNVSSCSRTDSEFAG